MAMIKCPRITPKSNIYGAECDGGSSPVWRRTDGAVGFADPNPYYQNIATTPSSPFDDISPWKDMEIVEDANAGYFVKIPKYYYKWTRTGKKMKLQISPEQFAGSHISPAHMDRGDGKGERDIVYVSRYHSGKTGNEPAKRYKSLPGLGTGGMYYYIADYRTNIHALGSDIWIYDFAMYWTIAMLYLVEFANWDTQSTIGFGNGGNRTGQTDNMPYHTGCIYRRGDQTSTTQYRYIEGLWDGAYQVVDGLRFDGVDIYIIKNPADFSSDSGGVKIGERTTFSWGVISEWSDPPAGYEYALLPVATDTSGDMTTYCCDGSGNTGNTAFMASFGGYYANATRNYGLFAMVNITSSNDGGQGIGTRLMKLP